MIGNRKLEPLVDNKSKLAQLAPAICHTGDSLAPPPAPPAPVSPSGERLEASRAAQHLQVKLEKSLI